MMTFIVSAVAFALLGLAGGDALTSVSDNPQISEATIENLRRVYGLDKPLPVRYFTWLSGAMTGELGESMYFRVPVATLIRTRFVSTLLLAAAALAIAITISFGLGVAAARYKSRWLSHAIETIVFATASTPRIVLSLVALAIVAQITITNVDIAPVAAFWFAAAALAAPLVSLFFYPLHDALSENMVEDFMLLATA